MESVLLLGRVEILSVVSLVGEAYEGRRSYVARVERGSVAVARALTCPDPRHAVTGSILVTSGRGIAAQNTAVVGAWGHSGCRSLLQWHVSKITVISLGSEHA